MCFRFWTKLKKTAIFPQAFHLNLHLKKRFPSCTKFLNLLRSNKLARQIKACVINSLFTCETFGEIIPKDLESIYYKLIKATLVVRQNTPNDIVLIEAGLLSLKAIIYCRQLNVFKSFQKSLEDGRRKTSINVLMIKHHT